MNAKKAKQLRKVVRRTGSTAHNQYSVKEHRERWVITGALNPDGTDKMIRFIPATLYYEATCARGIYRALKKLNK